MRACHVHGGVYVCVEFLCARCVDKLTCHEFKQTLSVVRIAAADLNSEQGRQEGPGDITRTIVLGGFMVDLY